MIISKPKGNTLFALGMFFLICFSLLGYTLYNFIAIENRYWYQYGIFLVITPITIIVLVKTIQSYKIIKLGKGKLLIRNPFLFNSKCFDMRDLEHWEEETIKTQGTTFKALKIYFKKGKVSLTSQENGEYDKIYAYIKNKHAKFRR